MKLTDIESVRSLLYKLKEKRELHALLSSTSSIHVTVNRGYRDDEHMHFGASEAQNQYEVDLIRTPLATIVAHDITALTTELQRLGVTFDGE